MKKNNAKIKSLLELYDAIPESERVLVDVLRSIVIDHLPEYCKEKISYNVPYFFGNKGICIIWPASIPRGGVKSGVLLGFGMVTYCKMQSNISRMAATKKYFIRYINRQKKLTRALWYDCLRKQ